MTWRPAIENGKASKHARQWKKFTCAKKFIDGCTLYQLYSSDEIIGHFNDFAEAKAKAEELDQQEQK